MRKTLSIWWREGQGRMVWQVDIPANCTATLRLPDGSTQTIGSGQRTFKTAIKRE